MGLSKTSFLHNGHLTIPWLWEEEESCAKSGRTHEVLLSYSPQQRVAYRCPHVNLCKHPRKIKRPYLFKHHRNRTTSPRVGPKSFTCRTFGWISAWSASFKPNEFSMRSCYQKLTATLHQARLWNFRVPNSDFNWEVSKHHGNWVPFYTTHHAWAVYHVAGWQDCKDPSRVAFHPFKTDAWPWKWVEPGENGL